MTVHPENDETKEVIKLLGYETTAADAGPVVRFAIFLLVLTLAIAGLVVGFYKYLDARERAAKAPRYPMAEMVERPLPPRPRLQTYPFTDITTMRADERKLLDEYAIEVLAERGLPHRTAPPAENEEQKGAQH